MTGFDITQPVPVTNDRPAPCVLEADTYDVEVLFQRINVLERALELVLDGNNGRARFALEAGRLRHPDGGRATAA